MSRTEWNSNLTCNTTYCMYIPSFKLISQNWYKKRNLCRKVYSRPLVYQIWRIYLDLWGHDCKIWVWPTFGCKLDQNDPIVMQLKLDMSCHLLNVYTKFQIDISKHVEEKSGKRGRTDGRTDRWTLPWHNTSRFSNGRIKTELTNTVLLTNALKVK